MIKNLDIENIAKDLGFDLVGFAPAERLTKETVLLKEWLENGFQAGMNYMDRNIDKKYSVIEILPEAQSVISLGMNYYINEDFEKKKNNGKISRYAWGKDYHFIIWEKLKKFIDRIKELDPKFEAKSYIDTGPVMDKAWAVRAGIGWQGKHTNIINRNLGSWFFIANIITNFKFEYSTIETDHCGSCRACIDACPTNAITAPYVLDSNKCISYLTIENKNEIPAEFQNKFENWLYGCDICQDVCPWNNKFAAETKVNEFHSKIAGKEIDLDKFNNMSNSIFQKEFDGSPLMRPRLKGMKRNSNFLKNEQL